MVSASTVSRFHRGRKKIRAGSERNNYKRGRFRHRARRVVNHPRLVFVDETSINTAVTRRHGRAPRGERAYDSASRDYDTRTPVIGATGPRGPVATPAARGAVDLTGAV